MPQDTEQPVHLDPFEGKGESIEVTRPINVSQLKNEITARVGQEVQIVLSVTDIDHVASPEHPAMLFLLPGNLNKQDVDEVIGAHVPIVVPAAVPVPTELPAETAAVMRKLNDGKTLTTAEITTLLKSIVGTSG